MRFLYPEWPDRPLLRFPRRQNGKPRRGGAGGHDPFGKQIARAGAKASISHVAIVQVVEVAHLGVLIDTQRQARLGHAKCMHAALDLLDVPLILT